MKKSALTSSLLLATVLLGNRAFARYTPELDKSHVRSIVYALFSYNEQRESEAKQDISTFVETLHADHFGSGSQYWKYSIRDGAIYIIDQSIQWISDRAYRKSYNLMMNAYKGYFPDLRTAFTEKEQVAKYVVSRMRSRSGNLVSRVRNEVERAQYNINATQIVNIIKSTLRTYVGSDLDSKIIFEIDQALNADCSICLMKENMFLIELGCGHWVHRGCYNSWRSSCFDRGLDTTCSFCRAVVEPYYRYYSAPVSPVLAGLHFSINLNDGSSYFSFTIK